MTLRARSAINQELLNFASGTSVLTYAIPLPLGGSFVYTPCSARVRGAAVAGKMEIYFFDLQKTLSHLHLRASANQVSSASGATRLYDVVIHMRRPLGWGDNHSELSVGCLKLILMGRTTYSEIFLQNWSSQVWEILTSRGRGSGETVSPPPAPPFGLLNK
jgi:hypothetical protein